MLPNVATGARRSFLRTAITKSIWTCWPNKRGRRKLTYGADDGLVKVRPALDRIPHLKELLKVETEDDFTELRRAEATGRPLGAPEFVSGLESLLGRKIARRAPGRKPTTETNRPEQLKLL